MPVIIPETQEEQIEKLKKKIERKKEHLNAIEKKYKTARLVIVSLIALFIGIVLIGARKLIRFQGAIMAFVTIFIILAFIVGIFSVMITGTSFCVQSGDNGASAMVLIVITVGIYAFVKVIQFYKRSEKQEIEQEILDLTNQLDQRLSSQKNEN